MDAALQQTFALKLYACQLALTADCFGFFARFAHGWFFDMLLDLLFTKNTLTLKLFLQRTQRLIDVVITNTNLHVVYTTFLSWICKNCRKWAYSKGGLVCLVSRN